MSATKFSAGDHTHLAYNPSLSAREVRSTRRGSSCRFTGSGLRYLPVHHEGNQAKSLEEAEAIARIVTDLLEGAQWQDKHNHQFALTVQDILVVAPYNAQVAALMERLPGLNERIGTVDPIFLFCTSSIYRKLSSDAGFSRMRGITQWVSQSLSQKC